MCLWYILYILPQLELLVKFAAYVPELVASSIETVYFYNPNMAFRQCALKQASTIRIFSHIKVRSDPTRAEPLPPLS